MQTLLRTPLYERHAALGARLVPFAGWEMPVQYEGVIPEHRAVRTDAGVFDVSHMGELEVEGPRAREVLQGALSNDLDRIGPGQAQYTLLTNEQGGIVDDLIVYELEPERFLLIVNASNREADFEWLREREVPGAEVRDVSDDYALLAVQGPRALERLGLPGAPAFTFADGEIDGVECMVNRTGYTGEEGVELLVPAARAGELWDRILERGVVPCGLGARDTLRLEVCYPLHGNDIGPETDAISAGLGWVCSLDKEFTGRGGAAADQGGRSRAEAGGVRDGRSRDPTPGDADRRRRRGHLRLPLAYARARDRARVRTGRAGAAGIRVDDRRSWPRARCARREEAHLFAGGGLMAAAESYPDDLRYHPEHDWARLEGEEAVFGITWFAQDALGELVHFEAPEEGATLVKDQPYAEVESVKAVSDVIAPLSGEVLEVNSGVAEAPETVNEDPYGAGWLVRVRLTDPGELDSLLDLETYKQHLAETA